MFFRILSRWNWFELAKTWAFDLKPCDLAHLVLSSHRKQILLFRITPLILKHNNSKRRKSLHLSPKVQIEVYVTSDDLDFSEFYLCINQIISRRVFGRKKWLLQNTFCAIWNFFAWHQILANFNTKIYPLSMCSKVQF